MASMSAPSELYSSQKRPRTSMSGEYPEEDERPADDEEQYDDAAQQPQHKKAKTVSGVDPHAFAIARSAMRQWLHSTTPYRLPGFVATTLIYGPTIDQQFALFSKLYAQHMHKFGRKLPVRKGKTPDADLPFIFNFYRSVVVRGGYMGVCKCDRWKEVMYSSGYSKNTAKQFHVIRRFYLAELLAFELLHQFQPTEQSPANLFDFTLIPNDITDFNKVNDFFIQLEAQVDAYIEQLPLPTEQQMTQASKIKMLLRSYPQPKIISSKAELDALRDEMNSIAPLDNDEPIATPAPSVPTLTPAEQARVQLPPALVHRITMALTCQTEAEHVWAASKLLTVTHSITKHVHASHNLSHSVPPAVVQMWAVKALQLLQQPSLCVPEALMPMQQLLDQSSELGESLTFMLFQSPDLVNTLLAVLIAALTHYRRQATAERSYSEQIVEAAIVVLHNLSANPIAAAFLSSHIVLLHTLCDLLTCDDRKVDTGLKRLLVTTLTNLTLLASNQQQDSNIQLQLRLLRHIDCTISDYRYVLLQHYADGLPSTTGTVSEDDQHFVQCLYMLNTITDALRSHDIDVDQHVSGATISQLMLYSASGRAPAPVRRACLETLLVFQACSERCKSLFADAWWLECLSHLLHHPDTHIRRTAAVLLSATAKQRSVPAQAPAQPLTDGEAAFSSPTKQAADVTPVDDLSGLESSLVHAATKDVDVAYHTAPLLASLQRTTQ